MRRIGFALSAALAAWLLPACPRGDDEPKSSPVGMTNVAVSALLFEDVTDRSGVDFRHETGGFGAKLLPETLGAGVAVFDQDGDGHLDLFFVNGGALPGRDAPRAASRLFRGRGDGTFEDVTEARSAGINCYGMGVAVGDADGDGDRDLYITALERNVYLRNDGDRFVDATDAANAGGSMWTDSDGRQHHEWSTAAAFVDADGDGDLDLFVGGYCKWREAGEIFTSLDGVTKAFTTPDRYPPLPCRLLLNDGTGRFSAAADSGLDEALGKALGIALWDFDDDGALDVVIANDTRPNFLFLSRRGRFDEIGTRVGIAYDENGRARAGMGIDVTALAPDGAASIAIGNFSSEPLSLWRRDGDGFRPEAREAGLAAATLAPLTFGVLFADFDLDGLDDLLVVNGHIEPEIARFRAGEAFAQRPQLFRGRSDGNFDDISDEIGADFKRPLVGRGAAYGDLDGDGDLDLVITQNGDSARILMNRSVERGSTRWIRVRVDGAGGSADAIGARVELTSNRGTRRRFVRGGSSYLSASEPTVTFGLADGERAARLSVTRPGESPRVVTEPAVGRVLRFGDD